MRYLDLRGVLKLMAFILMAKLDSFHIQDTCGIELTSYLIMERTAYVLDLYSLVDLIK